jgi:hypothetical protein
MKSPIDMNEEEMRSRFDFSKATRGRFYERYQKGHSTTLLDHDPNEESRLDSNSVSDSTRQSGKRIFESHVRAAGLKLDEPSDKNGIDYILYREDHESRKRVSYFVKVRTSIHEVFSLYKNDSQIPRLLVAYVWHAKKAEESSIYALTYEEALRIVESKPYVTSKSWNEEGGYSVTHAGAELREMLKPYLMTEQRWLQKLQAV